MLSVAMTNIHNIIKTVLITEFQISEAKFDWDIPMVELQPKFKYLQYLKDFEKALSLELNQSISLINQSSFLIHSANDIAELIKENYKH